MMVGAMAFLASGESKKAMSSIYMGNGGAAISFLLGVGVRNLKLKKGEPGYKTLMICIHLGFIFPLLFASAIGWRLNLAWDNPAKAYLKPYFLIIIAASILTSVMIYLEKPKKSKTTEKKDEDSVKENEKMTKESVEETAAKQTTRRRSRKASAM